MTDQILAPFSGADMRERFVRYFHVQVDPAVWTGKASIHTLYADYCARSNVEPESPAVFFAGVAAMLDDQWASDRHQNVVHLAVDGVQPLRRFDGCSPSDGPAFAVLQSNTRARFVR